MSQALLPLIVDGASEINDRIAVVQKDGYWTYFCGIQPVFRHAVGDQRSFLMFIAQLCAHGACTQTEVRKTFGVSKKRVLRAVAKYRKEGIRGFFEPRRARGASIMTPLVTAQAQELLDQGHDLKAVAAKLSVKYDTLRKAVKRGLLRQAHRAVSGPVVVTGADSATTALVVTDKSTRSDIDAAAGDGMGIACTRTCERVLAAVGLLPGGAPIRFEACRDVTYGGVLCALPALVENGLLQHLSALPVLMGLYTTLHVILALAFMALCRIKSVEQLQYEDPGELGKLSGLDRIPEVRCMREKMAALSVNGASAQWAVRLSRQWMEDSPDLAGALFVDGHVRLYHGKLTELPRRYVSRQRLCLRGTTAYYVNDVLGQPFFCVERPIDHGMLEALRTEIVPRLLQDVPSQPTEAQLEADPILSRFVLLFDREGYSPTFIREMWITYRIACITYHKHPEEAWPEALFVETKVSMPGGEVVVMLLAERETWIGSTKEGVKVREVRKLTQSGHQTSLISTAYGLSGPESAGLLFSRWSQENFFRYMMQHFAIDALNEHRTEPIPGTSRPVVNPARRELDRQYRSARAKLTQRQARFAALTMHPEAEEPELLKWQQQMASLREEIEHLERETAGLKERMASTPKHLAWDELPAKDKFERLAPSRKQLTDTVKLLAYRAETALARIVQDEMSNPEDARSLVRDLFRSDADLCPDEAAGVLTVRLHTLANPRSNRAVQHLLDELNAAEMTYPGTTLRLVYTLSSASETKVSVPS